MFMLIFKCDPDFNTSDASTSANTNKIYVRSGAKQTQEEARDKRTFVFSFVQLFLLALVLALILCVCAYACVVL